MLNQVFTNQYPTWTVGVSVNYPVGRATEDANYARATLEHEMLHLYLHRLGKPSGHNNLFKQAAKLLDIRVFHDRQGIEAVGEADPHLIVRDVYVE